MVERIEREATGKGKRQLGASLVEFTLLVALVAVVAVGSVRRLGDSVTLKLNDATAEIDGSGSLQCDTGHPYYPNC